jgi:energy-coupling factor transporter ATP-binding protein EcfA2
VTGPAAMPPAPERSDAPVAGSEIPILSVRNIAKRFGAVQALRDVDLDAYPGEVLALVGDNGAGKSTLIKIISGAYQPDAGHVAAGRGHLHLAQSRGDPGGGRPRRRDAPRGGGGPASRAGHHAGPGHQVHDRILHPAGGGRRRARRFSVTGSASRTCPRRSPGLRWERSWASPTCSGCSSRCSSCSGSCSTRPAPGDACARWGATWRRPAARCPRCVRRVTLIAGRLPISHIIVYPSAQSPHRPHRRYTRSTTRGSPSWI